MRTRFQNAILPNCRADKMEKNHNYLLQAAQREIEKASGAARVLDFGCGGGEIVVAGRERGLSIWGVEVFYEGSRAREIAREAGALGRTVLEFRDGRTPFADDAFDVVVSNQVLEHIEDVGSSLREIHRILRPGGLLVTLFPSKEVIREGHCGIPMLHRFPSDSKTRYAYALAMRTIGFGSHKNGGHPTRRAWTRHKLSWLDRFVHYRSRDELLGLLEPLFAVENREQEYLRFRVGESSPRLKSLLTLARADRWGAWTSRQVVNRLAGLAIAARKK